MEDNMLVPARLSPAEVAGLLRAALEVVKAEVSALDQAQVRWRPSENAWCINEVVGHLIEAEERGFAGRIRSILEQDHPHFETWDQPAVARARRDCERDGQELVRAFEQVRLASVQLVGSLRDDQMDRPGQHPVVGELSVRDLLHEWVHHDRNHLQQIFDNVKSLVWPQMGNSRKFYDQDL